jgi:hypothetical protein
MKNFSEIIRVMAFGGALAGSTFAATVAPTANQTVEGNSAYTIGASGVGSVNIELVLSSNFTGPVQITGFELRPDSNLCGGLPCGSFSTTLNQLTVDLATSTMNNTSDLTYADYLTTNVQTVISGSLAISSSDTGPAGGPNAFDIVFPFATPYSYDPSSGNLVLYMQIDDPSSGIPNGDNFDAATGSSVYRIFGASPDIGGGICGCNFATSGLGDNTGWVVQFDTAPISTATPEPGTAWLLVPSLLGAAAWGKRKRAHR